MSTKKQREARRRSPRHKKLMRQIEAGTKRTAERAEARLVKRAKLAAGPDPSEWIKRHANFLMALQPDPEAARQALVDE